jgi:short-subunit dehydrogenase
MCGMHVAITGASSGIGEALAREFAKAGAVITLVARRKDNLDRIAHTLKTPTYVKPADLGELKLADAWVRDAEEALGPIDVLINNAGAQIVAAFDETDPSEGEQTVALNLLAPARIMRAVLPGMLKRRSGTIVNISSMAGVSLNPGMFYYNAGKAGIAAASEGLRAELRGTGVNVITVYPGPVHTAMANVSFERHEMKPGKIPTGTPEEMARRIRTAVEYRKARVIYPSFYMLGYILPHLARYLVGRVRPPFLKKYDNWMTDKS